MNKDKLKDFLKDYAKILREGVDISNDLPLTSMVNMPSGCVKISTSDDGPGGARLIIWVSVEDGGGPSMPVSPAAMTYARLIVDLINKYYEEKSE